MMDEKSSIPNRPDHLSAPSISEKPPFPVYASIGDRLIARVVDRLVAFGVFFFIGMTLAPQFGGATESGFDLAGRLSALSAYAFY